MTAKIVNVAARRTASRRWLGYLLPRWSVVGAAALALVLGVSACTGQSTPQTLPTVVLDGSGSASGVSAATTDGANHPAAILAVGGVVASGVVAPDGKSQVVSALGGSVAEVLVAKGDAVQSGQVLVRLSGSEKLAAAVAAAQYELLSAQQAVTDLNDGAAQARAAAQLRLANAAEALKTAQDHRSWKEYRVGSDTSIDVARADLIVAEDNLKKAQDVYGGYADSPEDNLNKAAALSAISAAQKARDKAEANLNYLLSMPDANAVAIADGELSVALAEYDAAQAALDKLQNGPDPEALTLAQARVTNAQAQLTSAQAALADLEIKAPIDGVVTSVDINAGEWAAPGQPLLSLVDFDPLHVETTDLSERDVVKIAVGQAVWVSVEALDNQEIPGKVESISPLASTLGGDVVYTTTITLDEIPTGLRSGMTVEVTFP